MVQIIAFRCCRTIALPLLNDFLCLPCAPPPTQLLLSTDQPEISRVKQNLFTLTRRVLIPEGHDTRQDEKPRPRLRRRRQMQLKEPGLTPKRVYGLYLSKDLLYIFGRIV